MDVLVVRSNGQITLPAGLRRQAGIEEGDVLAAQVEDGIIVLRPKVLVDKDQAYFYTDRWQAGEREAEEDIRAGRGRKFGSMRELIETVAREHDIDPAEVLDD